MLGKGLESLIPQKGGQNPQNGGANDGQHAPADPSAPNSETPQTSPAPFRQEPSAPPPYQPEQSQSQVSPQPQPQTQPKPQLPIQTVQKKDELARESIFHLEIEKIKPNPDQPRRNFNEEGIRELASSIREFGMLQPLVVTKVEKESPTGIDVEYQLIAGERRYMASKLLGLHVVPAIIRNVHLEREKLELAVIENIQRENLNPIETARAFQRLQEEFRMTQREIAAKLGKSREVVANAMRLLDLPDYIRLSLEKGEMSESHARLLLGMEDPGAQKRLYDDILQNKLTTRDVRERVQMFSSAASGARRGRPPITEENTPPELRAAQEELSSALGAPVEIRQGMNTGKITITFYSPEELESILQKLRSEREEGF